MTTYNLQRGPCHDPDNIFHIHSMYDLAVELGNRMWTDREAGDLGELDKWSDFAIGTQYDRWMRCVANDASTGVNLNWIEQHGGDKPPSQSDFINAVCQRPDIHALDKLKGW